MKRYLFTIFFILQLLLPGQIFALEKLSENQMKQVHAQSGVSMAISNASIYLDSHALSFTTVDNMDPFGASISGSSALGFNNLLGLVTLDSQFHFDVGIYDDINGSLDGQYGVIQASVQDLRSSFDLRSSVSFCEKELGTIGVSGIFLPEFSQDGVNLPGSVVTLFPGQGCSINLEVKLRLTFDDFEISGSGSSVSPDFAVSGIHFGEAFDFPLPDHLEDTGTTGIITPSEWGNDIVSIMHSGYFLLGNLNQIQSSGENGSDPLFIANPFSINVTASDTRTYVSVSTGLQGSIRIESIKGWNESDMGPIAIDKISVKHCVVEFPGEYKRLDGSFTGRIDPSQLDWLNDLNNQP